MSSYTHYNIRFRLKENQKVSLEDYESLQELLFFNKDYQEYSQRISSSWSGMFIFELCDKSNSIILETTPIRSHYLTEFLDDIRDNGKYTIWTICTYEEGPDWLEIYDNRLKENYFAYCLYLYDEINILFKELNHWTEKSMQKNFVKTREKSYQYRKLGQYYSHNEINDDSDKERKSNLQNKCALADKENYILNNCYKETPESHHYVETNWYSDPIIWSLMATFEKGRFKDKIDRIEFRYKGKLVRLYNDGIHDECYMLDDWSNLDKEIFKDWRKEFQLKK